MQILVGSMRATAIAAALVFAASVVLFGAITPGYSQALHPVGLLGARGMPWGLAFDALAFVLPGLLCARVMLALRDAVAAPGDGVGARRPWARLGASMLVLSALAFALQGVLRLRTGPLDDAATAAHASTWTFWWLAYGAGAAAFGVGTRGTARASYGRALLGCAACSIVFALAMPGLIGAGLSQRVAFAAWFAAVLVAASAVAQLHPENHR